MILFRLLFTFNLKKQSDDESQSLIARLQVEKVIGQLNTGFDQTKSHSKVERWVFFNLMYPLLLALGANDLGRDSTDYVDHGGPMFKAEVFAILVLESVDPVQETVLVHIIN